MPCPGEASIDDRLEQHAEMCHAGLEGLATWLQRYYAPGRAGPERDGGGTMAAAPPTGTTQGEQEEQPTLAETIR